MTPDPKAITRYHVNPAFTAGRDIYADGAEIARNQRVLHLSGVVGQQPLAALYDARRRHLPNVAPASTTLIVQGLAAPEWLIEIEAIAAVGQAPREGTSTEGREQSRPDD